VHPPPLHSVYTVLTLTTRWTLCACVRVLQVVWRFCFEMYTKKVAGEQASLEPGALTVFLLRLAVGGTPHPMRTERLATSRRSVPQLRRVFDSELTLVVVRRGAWAALRHRDAAVALSCLA
jgi:hypothetical protein